MNVRNPKVSVLMPVYNGEEYLRESIESILNQTFRDFEFIIISEHGTSDESLAIIQSYSDERIRHIHNTTRLGLVVSLNLGLKEAKSEYIARMDADDISYPKRFEIQYNYMKKNPDCGLVASWNEVIDERGDRIELWKNNYSSEEIYYILNFRNCLTHTSTFFRKNLVISVNGYNESLKAEDYDLWLRLSKITRVHQIPKILVKWRYTEKSITGKGRDLLTESAINIAKKNIKNLSNEIIDEKLLCFIQNYRENPNIYYLSALTKDELPNSIKLINKINQKIINEAPFSLNKRNIKKIAGKRLANYIYILRLKIGTLNSVRYVHRHVEGNILLKLKIIVFLLYHKVRLLKENCEQR
jgi:glycosyltransferase involved in cell wall biosynthesis